MREDMAVVEMTEEDADEQNGDGKSAVAKSNTDT